MNKTTLVWIILLLILLVGAIADTTINPLTRGQASSLFCLIDGTNCALGGGFVNGTDIEINKLNFTNDIDITDGQGQVMSRNGSGAIIIAGLTGELHIA